MKTVTAALGPRIDDQIVAWSLPEEERALALRERALLIVMHGYGSHENDLISLAPMLPQELVIASLRAPLVAPAPIVNGFSWYPIAEPGRPDLAPVDSAAREVLAWLDRVEAQYRVTVRAGALGFSQGGAMSLQLLRNAPDRIVTAVNLSGFVVGGGAPHDDELVARKPPVFWGYSDSDAIVPRIAVHRTAEWLQEHATTTARMYPGIGHAISGPEIEDVAAFLREHLVG